MRLATRPGSARGLRPEHVSRWFVAAPALLAGCLVGLLSAGITRADAVQPDAAPHAAASPPRVQPAAADPIAKRVAIFKKALDLDPAQEAQLHRILAEQREAVQRIWADNKLLPAERAPATRAVEERTGDRIREMLSAEQRKKYNPPKPPTPPDAGSNAPDVEKWMTKTRPQS